MMRTVIKIFLITFLILAQNVVAADDTLLVRALVEKFVSEEFEGKGCARDDEKIVKYDNETQKMNKSNLNGACVYLNAFPLEVVGKFEVVDTEIKKNTGTVVVAFRRLGRTTGIGFYERKVIADLAERELVEYRVVKRKGRWFIYNPPDFHVSKKAFSEYYLDTVKANDAIKDNPLISKSQKEYFRINRTTLDSLLALPD